MSKGLYIAACVLVPLAWGVAVVWVFNRIDSWRKRGKPVDSGNDADRESITGPE